MRPRTERSGAGWIHSRGPRRFPAAPGCRIEYTLNPAGAGRSHAPAPEAQAGGLLPIAASNGHFSDVDALVEAPAIPGGTAVAPVRSRGT